MKIVQTILFVFLFLEFRAQNNMALLFAETEPISLAFTELEQLVFLELISPSDAQLLKHFF